MLQCIWVQVIEIQSVVDYLPLDLLLFKHMGSFSIGLEFPWCQGTVLASMFFSWPSLLVTRWHGSILHVLMWWHPKKIGMGRKKCFSPCMPLLYEVKCFPEPLRGLPFIMDQKWVTCPSLHHSLSNGNILPWLGCSISHVKWARQPWMLAIEFTKTQDWITVLRERTWD